MIIPIKSLATAKIYDHGISDKDFDITIILLLLHIPLIIGAKISKRNKVARRILFFIYTIGMVLFIFLITINLFN